MAPIPPSPDHPHANHVPPLHLKAFDLDHPGALRILSHPTSFPSLVKESILKVLSGLYPPGVTLSLPKTVKGASGYNPGYVHPPPRSRSSSASSAGGSSSSASEASSDSSVEEDDAGPPPVRSITLHLREFDGVAHTCGSKLDDEHKEVHLSVSYIDGVEGDRARIAHEIEGVLVHELVHAFQFDGEGTCPGGVIEGIADWVRLGEGLGPPHWSERGGDDKWAGYEVTGTQPPLAFVPLHGNSLTSHSVLQPISSSGSRATSSCPTSSRPSTSPSRAASGAAGPPSARSWADATSTSCGRSIMRTCRSRGRVRGRARGRRCRRMGRGGEGRRGGVWRIHLVGEAEASGWGGSGCGWV